EKMGTGTASCRASTHFFRTLLESPRRAGNCVAVFALYKRAQSACTETQEHTMAAANLDEAAIFDAARQIADYDARRQYIQEACGADSHLQGRIEALLRVHENEGTFLTAPADELRSFLASSQDGPGAQIGPY